MKWKLTVYFILIAFSCFSQEKLGIANSNYSTTNSIFLNPAYSAGSKTFAQLNLVGANVYLFNNQVYMPNFSVRQVIKGYNEEVQVSSIKLKKFIYAKAAVQGPAFVLSTREIGAGFFVNARSEGDFRNIPYQVTKIALQQTVDANSFGNNVDIRNLKMSNMTWVEYGANFSKMIKKQSDEIITVGGNLKYLTGINIMYANLERVNIDFTDTSANVKQAKGKLRFNTPNWNTGKGVGLDLGITYKKMLLSADSYYANSPKGNCTNIDYRYKVGVSLLDVGAIRYKTDTYKGDIDAQLKIDNFKNPTSVDSIVKYSYSISQKNNSPIWATIPTGLSIQGDLNLNHNFYLSGTFIKNLVPTRAIGVQRANLISIAPRFEHKQVEVAMPLTFHRYIYPQLGLALRVRTFVLGFDNVLPFVLKKDTYGLNVYFSLGISLFKNPLCWKNGFSLKSLNLGHKSNRRSSVTKDADCPEGFVGKYMMPSKTKKKGLFRKK